MRRDIGGRLAERLGAWACPVIALAALCVASPVAAKQAVQRLTKTAAAPSSAELSFTAALDLAWQRLPQRNLIVAQQATAQTHYDAGAALFPDAPAATGTYVNDKIAGSNYNYITSQVEVSTPLWLPGEGTATQQAASAQTAAIAAEAASAHLALAVQLLDLVERGTLATGAEAIAVRRLATAKALAADAQNRFQTGEGAQADALAASAEAAAAQASLLDAQAQVKTAQAALAVVTGDPRIPRLAPVPTINGARMSRPTGADAIEQHPQVRAAEQQVAAAEANARLVAISNRQDPAVGVQGINEKQPGTRWDTRFGVVVHFYFATEGRNAPRRAAAEELVTRAEVALEQTRRAVLASVRQADAASAAAAAADKIVAQAADEQERRRGMIERAWRLGEMPLIEVVRADAAASDAAFTATRSRTTLAAARLRLVLAEGRLP